MARGKTGRDAARPESLVGDAMISRLRERQSRLAAWSAWLAALSIPVLVIAAIGHRVRLLDATPTYATMALGFSIAALAVIAAAAAFAAIWRDGRKGAGSALRGLVVGLAVLSIPAFDAWQIVSYPRLTDVSTAPDHPPRFVRAFADRGADDLPITAPDDDDIAVQRAAYPDIVSRHYPVSTARIFDEARAIVDRRRWSVLDARAPSEIDETGRIEAVAVTLLFGFRHDVAIVIVPDGDGALVDMRSAARNAAHDLGANARRIRKFLADLDRALQGISGD
jgi:uncharacterized protein (DUF1499 family)